MRIESRFDTDLARETVALILAGGNGTRLGELTRWQCKPAITFAGHFRNIDFTLSKNFQISEKMRLQVRADSFNTTNTVRFGFPNTAFGDGGFGTINSQINYPRRVQMGARFSF